MTQYTVISVRLPVDLLRSVEARVIKRPPEPAWPFPNKVLTARNMRRKDKAIYDQFRAEYAAWESWRTDRRRSRSLVITELLEKALSK